MPTPSCGTPGWSPTWWATTPSARSGWLTTAGAWTAPPTAGSPPVGRGIAAHREFRRHGRRRRPDRGGGGASGHLVPPVAGPHRTGCRSPAALGVRVGPRPEPPGNPRDGCRRRSPAARVGVRADQARLLDLRGIGPVGLPDGRPPGGRRRARARPWPDHRRSPCRLLPSGPGGRGGRDRAGLQRGRAPGSRAGARPADRGRHVRKGVGTDAPDGGQHPCVPACATPPVLHRRRRLRGLHSGHRLEEEPPVPRPCRPVRHGPLRLGRPGQSH